MVDIRSLTRRFGEREVVSGLDLRLERGEGLALRGGNGSGKSTILRCVIGSMRPSEGEILIGGHQAGSVAAKRLIGATLSQERSFYLRLNGRQNLQFFARLCRNSRREADARVDRVVEELEIGDIAARRLDRCSTGMVQQLGYARALLAEPALLVLDEPTRSLDADAAARLWAAADRRPETAVLIATHRDEDVSHCGGAIDVGHR